MNEIQVIYKVKPTIYKQTMVRRLDRISANLVMLLRIYALETCAPMEALGDIAINALIEPEYITFDIRFGPHWSDERVMKVVQGLKNNRKIFHAELKSPQNTVQCTHETATQAYA